MQGQKFSNFFKAKLTSALDAVTESTTFTIEAGKEVFLPPSTYNDYFVLTIFKDINKPELGYEHLYCWFDSATPVQQTTISCLRNVYGPLVAFSVGADVVLSEEADWIQQVNDKVFPKQRALTYRKTAAFTVQNNTEVTVSGTFGDTSIDNIWHALGATLWAFDSFTTNHVIELKACVTFAANATGIREVWIEEVVNNLGIKKYGRALIDVSSANEHSLIVVSQPIRPAANSVYRLKVKQTSGGYLDILANSWFSMKILDN